MKKILLLIACSIIFTSCSVTVESKVTSRIFDLRKYVESGFIISPTSTGFKYEPVCEIKTDVTVGYTSNVKGVKTVDLKELFDRAMEKFIADAKRYGANGVLNFQITYHYTSPSYTISGFAVKIKE